MGSNLCSKCCPRRRPVAPFTVQRNCTPNKTGRDKWLNFVCSAYCGRTQAVASLRKGLGAQVPGPATTLTKAKSYTLVRGIAMDGDAPAPLTHHSCWWSMEPDVSPTAPTPLNESLFQWRAWKLATAKNASPPEQRKLVLSKPAATSAPGGRGRMSRNDKFDA